MRSIAPRTLGAPRGARVQADRAGRPRSLNGREVVCVRDEWRVDEGWWTGRSVRRQYFDLVLAGGLSAVVFRDRRSGRWFTQRG